jgi:hypothetical protein
MGTAQASSIKQASRKQATVIYHSGDLSIALLCRLGVQVLRQPLP